MVKGPFTGGGAASLIMQIAYRSQTWNSEEAFRAGAAESVRVDERPPTSVIKLEK